MSGDPGPLQGRRVLVTRAPHQASALADLLREHGATPILVPTIEIAAPTSWCALDAALASLRAYDLVVFTSANAVRTFDDRTRRHRLVPSPRSIAAVGPATAQALDAIGLSAALIPPAYTAEALAAALAPTAWGQQILLVRAEQAPLALPDALVAAGASVTLAAAYSNRVPPASIPLLRQLFAQPEMLPDAATFTSASTAVNLHALLDSAAITLPYRVLRASIGPVTSQAMRELGWPPHVESAQATIPGLVAALASHFSPQSQRS
jgi:uroporphyrinogen-III synthase